MIPMLCRSIVFDAVSDDFFYFNVIADAIRKAVESVFHDRRILSEIYPRRLA